MHKFNWMSLSILIKDKKLARASQLMYVTWLGFLLHYHILFPSSETKIYVLLLFCNNIAILRQYFLTFFTGLSICWKRKVPQRPFYKPLVFMHSFLFVEISTTYKVVKYLIVVKLAINNEWGISKRVWNEFQSLNKYEYKLYFSDF